MIQQPVVRKWGNVDVLWEEKTVSEYDWEVFALLRKQVAGNYQYAYYADSGCSCCSNQPYGCSPEDCVGHWENYPYVPIGSLCTCLTGSWAVSDSKRIRASRQLHQLEWH